MNGTASTSFGDMPTWLQVFVIACFAVAAGALILDHLLHRD